MDILLKNVSESNFRHKILKASKHVFTDDQKRIAKNIVRHQGYKTSSIPLQDAIEAKYLNLYDDMLENVYAGVCNHLGLTLQKAQGDEVFTIKGKVFFSPKTGKPLTKAQWAEIKKAIKKFTSSRTKDIAKQFSLEENSLGTILERMEKQGVRLEDIKSNMVMDKVYDNIKDYTKEYNWFEQELYPVFTQVDRFEVKISDMDTRIQDKVFDTVNNGIVNRKTTSQISSDLLDQFGSLNRDWQRIASYESQYAFNYGYCNSELKHADEGETVYMQSVSQPDACKHCKRLLNGKIYILKRDGQYSDKGDEFAEGTIVLGTTNIGLKVADYIPTIPLHPHCRCRWVRFYKEFANIDL